MAQLACKTVAAIHQLSVDNDTREDVSEVTGSVSSAAGSIDSITKAPANLVSTISTKVSDVLGGRKSSDVAEQLAQAKAQAEAAQVAPEEPKAAPQQEPQSKAEASSDAPAYFTYGQEKAE